MSYEEQPSFEDVLKKNKDKMYRICRIYAITPIEPQDLFQEVVYHIWKSLPSFKKISSIDTWIYRVTLNVCMRSKLKLEKVSTKTVRYEAIQFMAAENSIDESQQERYKLLKECIATLNESDTSIIILYLEELSYKEIALITGLSENHIAVKMKRIRKRLFDCITLKLR